MKFQALIMTYKIITLYLQANNEVMLDSSDNLDNDFFASVAGGKNANDDICITT